MGPVINHQPPQKAAEVLKLIKPYTSLTGEMEDVPFVPSETISRSPFLMTVTCSSCASFLTYLIGSDIFDDIAVKNCNNEII